MIPRKEIWGEVGLNLLVRGVWAGFFLAWGVAAHDIYDNPWAFGGMVVATACLLVLAVLFEWRRAVVRLRRHYRHQLSEGQREHFPEYGLHARRVHNGERLVRRAGEGG